MNKWLALFVGISVGLIGCAKKPPPEPPPPPPEPFVAPEPEPEPEPIPQGPSEEELLARRVEELLNQILGNKVYFDFDKAELMPEAKDILAEVGRIMQDGEAGKRISVTIEGHTDPIGTEDYNLALGERRARAVMEYLEGYGIEESRLNLISYGEERLTVTDAGSIEDNRPNRRSEFRATANIR